VGLFTNGYVHARYKVGGSNPGRGTTLGGIFIILARLFLPNMPFIVNSKLRPGDEIINYRPICVFLIQRFQPLKITATSVNIIIIIY